MTVQELESWLLKEEQELEKMLYSRNNEMPNDEYLIKQGRLEEVKRIRRKINREG